MAKTGDRHDPAFAFRFTISIDQISRGGFSECTGLQLETEIKDYPEGGLNTYIHKFPTRTKQSNIVLKRGIVDKELWDWYDKVVQGKLEFKTGSIIIHDPAGKEVIKWEFNRAYPCKWNGPDLNATQNNVAVATLELCHHGLKRIK